VSLGERKFVFVHFDVGADYIVGHFRGLREKRMYGKIVEQTENPEETEIAALFSPLNYVFQPP
jgi:hypothetical protein